MTAAGGVPAAREPSTMPQILAARAATWGDQRVALQEKRYGIWQPITWREYHERVRAFAHGLAALGVKGGEVVAVLGDNRPEWLITELAVQSIGGATVGIYPTSIGEEIVHILTHARVRVVVAEDQEQADKLIELWDRLSGVEKLIYYDPRGLEFYDLPYLLEFTAVAEMGRRFEEEHPGWLDEQVAAGRGEDIAILATTSGTTGLPKLSMLSHSNLLAEGRSLMAVDPMAADDRYVSFLPLAWVGEQMLSMACGMQAGFTLSFPEEAQTVQSDLREIGPSVMFSPPRIWESMISSLQVRLSEAGWLKRRVFAWGFEAGERSAEDRVRGYRPGWRLRLRHRVADWVALRPVRDHLGLARLRRAYTGGAPLGPDVFRFFHAIGVNLKQIYGQTEVAGIAVLHRDGDIKFNTVGGPTPGTDLRIAPDGEILLRSPAVFQGYYENPEASLQALDGEGWLHTGDAGYLDEDDHLVVIDRAKDVMQMPDGTRFSPAFIENKLKFSPYVEEAVVFGGERPFVGSIITIDMETVGAWAERERLSYTTYTDLAQKPEVYRLVAEDVARANDDLPEGARVRRFVLLHKQFDADDDEITRTRKVRRRTINDRYGGIIDALYQDVEEVTVTTTVTYQDGSTVEREIGLQVMSMDDFVPSAGYRRFVWSGR